MRRPFSGPVLAPPEALSSALTPQLLATTASAATAVMLVNHVRARTAVSLLSVVRLPVSVAWCFSGVTVTTANSVVFIVLTR